MNRPLGEDRGLGCSLRFVVVVLQRQQQRQVWIAVKGALIGTKIDRAETGDEPIVSEVELSSRLDHLFITASVELRTQTRANRVPNLNQTANPRTCLAGQICETSQDVFLADADDSVVD